MTIMGQLSQLETSALTFKVPLGGLKRGTES
jgi:hypothetical protein